MNSWQPHFFAASMTSASVAPLSAHADIVHDRKVKEVVVLRHIGDVLRALRQRQRANVHAAQVDFSVLHIPQGGDEPGDGGFSTAGRPDQCVDRPRGNVQIDSVQYLLVVIGKADIFQLDGVVRRQLSARSGRCISSPDSTSATSPTMVVTCAMSSV